MATYVIDKKTGEYVLEKKSFLKEIEQWIEWKYKDFNNFIYEAKNYLWKSITNKWKRRVVNTALNSYPWDFGFIYDLEYAKIQEMLHHWEDYVKKSKQNSQDLEETEYILINNKTYQSIRQMKICLSCLEIFMDKKELYTFEGKDGEKAELNFYENENRDYKGDKTYSLEFNHVKKLLINVNLKNWKRFVENKQHEEYFKENPEELYKLKAKKIYHQIRYEYDEYWWI